MTGLRARQKADRRGRILGAASKLFREHGYEPVRMDAIAAAADVSIGTIYNYYRNKGDLLVAIVAMEVNEVLESGEQIVTQPPRIAEKAVDKLIGIYIEHSLVYLSKEMWRQAMAISTQQPDSPFGVSYAEQDVALANQMSRLIAKLQALGLIRKTVDVHAVGELIFNNTNMMFTVFVKTDKMTVAALRAAIRNQLCIVFEAIKA